MTSWFNFNIKESIIIMCSQGIENCIKQRNIFNAPSGKLMVRKASSA